MWPSKVYLRAYLSDIQENERKRPCDSDFKENFKSMHSGVTNCLNFTSQEARVLLISRDTRPGQKIPGLEKAEAENTEEWKYLMGKNGQKKTKKIKTGGKRPIGEKIFDGKDRGNKHRGDSTWSLKVLG